VVACYSVLDHFMPACGYDDFTEGMYEGDPHRPYQAAQARQAEVRLRALPVVVRHPAATARL
jgi:hypothetical protein